MSSPELEKKRRESSSSDPELARNEKVVGDESQEGTLHRGLKARQVSRPYTFHPFDLYLE